MYFKIIIKSLINYEQKLEKSNLLNVVNLVTNTVP